MVGGEKLVGDEVGLEVGGGTHEAWRCPRAVVMAASSCCSSAAAVAMVLSCV
jgi:hypothetical protein